MVAILMMSAKLAALDLLKIKVSRKKGYHVTNKILSRDKILSYCTVDVVM